MDLNPRQAQLLLSLDLGPQSSSRVFSTLPKNRQYSSIRSTHMAFRRLEDRGLVRAREQKGTDIILWELTAKGRKLLSK